MPGAAPRATTPAARGGRPDQPAGGETAGEAAGEAWPSILFPTPGGDQGGGEEMPAFFRDLNLDQVLAALVAGREDYGLARLFHTPLAEPDAVGFRHEVFRDLQTSALSAAVGSFAAGMRQMRAQLGQAERLHYPRQRQRWFLDAVQTYCRTLATLAEALAQHPPSSQGLRAVRAYLDGYLASEGFTALRSQAASLLEALAAVRYCLTVKGSRITVASYDGEADYSDQVQRTFEKFRQGAVRDYRVRFSDWPEMNHVEAAVLDMVARLNPELFAELAAFCQGYQSFADATLLRFEGEVQFYLAYLDYLAPLAAAGLPLCYPAVSARSKEVRARDTFDIALAATLVHQGLPVVCNDFHLAGDERVIVVSGPNQGGKTTFARTFGQLHHLAALGCPVPGRQAQLFLPDRIFTHFEREEDLGGLQGKLADELERIHEILAQATSRSIVIMNESFSSTTLSDAVLLGTAVLRQVVELDLLCVCVTFVEELARLGQTVVSMVTTVRPEDPVARTYQILRRPPDGLAYALAVAERYGLTYQRLKERLGT